MSPLRVNHGINRPRRPCSLLLPIFIHRCRFLQLYHVGFPGDAHRIGKCMCGHLSSLLISWDRNGFGNKFSPANKRKQAVCSRHKTKHRKSRPITNLKITKSDAIDYMAQFKALGHVGTRSDLFVTLLCAQTVRIQQIRAVRVSFIGKSSHRATAST
ncbi:hypothetical protein PENTCL1PPCAC_14212 [Pristionchus entomophagus]|uniref:Ribosomal protein n=1 Tax=Pristionchus entomophagus TaxID=358040 RepID=A0AAV5T8Y2_9BILA|nr:hypothetical protein PENTCL1PPCAC_14212 [Pristionchus entomophagus]